MSTNVRSYGFIAVLKQEADPGEVFDRLWNAKSPLGVNNDGTLVYIDFNATKSYSERENIYGLFIGQSEEGRVHEFLTECNRFGLFVHAATVKPYNCIWYNGSDSDMANLTKEEFLAS